MRRPVYRQHPDGANSGNRYACITIPRKYKRTAANSLLIAASRSSAPDTQSWTRSPGVKPAPAGRHSAAAIYSPHEPNEVGAIKSGSSTATGSAKGRCGITGGLVNGEGREAVSEKDGKPLAYLTGEVDGLGEV